MEHDEAEKWLKKHDPEYGKRSSKYPYLNADRLAWVYRKEIPVSLEVLTGILDAETNGMDTDKGGKRRYNLLREKNANSD